MGMGVLPVGLGRGGGRSGIGILRKGVLRKGIDRLSGQGGVSSRRLSLAGLPLGPPRLERRRLGPQEVLLERIDGHVGERARYVPVALIGLDEQLLEILLVALEADLARSLQRAARVGLHAERIGTLQDGLTETVDGFIGAMPETDFTPPLFELLREAYTPGRTLPQGFRSVVAEVLKDLPIVFVDAANPELKAASLPVLLRELEEAAASGDGKERSSDPD